jgi:hypothetical protein
MPCGCLWVVLFFALVGVLVIGGIFVKNGLSEKTYFEVRTYELAEDNDDGFYILQAGRGRLVCHIEDPPGEYKRPGQPGETLVRLAPYISASFSTYEITAVKFLEVSALLSGGGRIDFFDATQLSCYTGTIGNPIKLTEEETEKFRRDRELEVITEYAPGEHAVPGGGSGMPARVIRDYGSISVDFQSVDIDFETVDWFDMKISLEFFYESGEKFTQTIVKRYQKEIQRHERA